MTIDELIERVFEREGRVYENVPHDNGGPTKYGVTLGDLRTDNPSATWQDVRDMTEAQAADIYKRRYWTGPKFDTLPEDIAEIMFDSGILHGVSWAAKALQRVLNQAGFGPVDEDGRIGPQTGAIATEASRQMGDYMVDALVQERLSHYERIVARNPTQQKFMKGWRNRAMSFWRELPGEGTRAA